MLFRLSLFLIISTLTLPAYSETRITTKTLAEVAIYPQVSVPATVLSLNNSKISAQVQAIVKKIPVLVGESVKRHDILVQLDDKDYKLNLKQAKVALKGAVTRLAFAQYQLDQTAALAKDNLVSDEKLQERQANVISLKAEKESLNVAVDLAKRNLSKCVVRAPFDAVVAQRLVQTGELASPGTPLLQIIDTKNIEVSTKLQARELHSIDGNDEYYFIADDATYQISLRNISPVLDLVQRNREARFIFNSTQAAPGSSGVVRWAYKAMHIPAELVLQRKNRLGVFIVNGDNARFVVLENALEGRPARTVLADSTTLVIDGRYGLQDGDLVTLNAANPENELESKAE